MFTRLKKAFVLAAFALTLPTIAQAMPVLTLSHNIVNYGVIPQHSDGARVLTFQNTGSSPLILANVQSSCGCIQVNAPMGQPIPPGAWGEVLVNYDTSRRGPFSKTIIFFSNAYPARFSLKVRGAVQ